MADTVAITAGAGTVIATQDESGVHYQEVKLTASGTGTTEALSKAEDTQHSTGHHGIMTLAVRSATAADLSVGGTDGDYEPLQVDATGRLHVNPGTVTVASHAVTNAGTFVVQVDAALPAGTNAIGKLAANSGVDIGDVDVLSIIPGTGTTNLGQAEDGTIADGKVGVLAMAKRNDTPANLSGTDGDAEFLQVSSGLLWTRVKGVLDADGDSVLNATADAVRVTLVDSTGAVVAAGAEYTEGDTDTTISGVAMLWEDASDTLRAVSSGKPLPVAIISGAGSGGTAMADDAAFTPGTTNITPMGGMFDDVSPDSVNEGDGGVVRMSANRNLYTTIRDAAGNERGLNIDANGALAVGSLPASTNTIEIVGDAAHDATVSGNPVLTGAEARDTQGTVVASGDVVRLAADRYGRLLTASMPPSHASSNGTPITATTTSVISAPSAGNHLRVVRLHLSNGGSTATWVAVRDGAAGTQYYRTYLPQGGLLSMNLKESGPLDLTTATRLDIVLSAAGSVEYTIDYFTVAD